MLVGLAKNIAAAIFLLWVATVVAPNFIQGMQMAQAEIAARDR